MNDTAKDNTSDDHLFENRFTYVTKEGEIVLKETKTFKERTIGKVVPESLEEGIENLQDAFAGLQSKFEALFADVHVESEEDLKKLQNRLDKLKEEAKEAEAIGDFDALLKGADDQLKELQDQLAEKSEEAQPEAADDTEESAEKEDEVQQEEADEEGPVAEESADEPAKEMTEKEEVKSSEQEKSEEEESEDSDPAAYYEELAEKAEALMDLTDWAYVSMEFDNIDTQWNEGPDPGETDITKYRSKIDKLREEFEQKKEAHYEEQKRIRQQNLEKKKDLLHQLKEIIDEKKWTHTREVSKIKGKWDSISPIPAAEQEKLDSQFNSYIATFDEHKVDRLVKKKQQEEDNLMGKLVIIEKMNSFLNSVDASSDWKELDKTFSKLTKQFRKIGRVPIEKNQEVWDKFHNAQDTFHSMRFKHDKKYRKNIEKYLSKKKQLIDEAEALIDADNLANAARKVNKLHRRWKKTGNLPQKEENELWDRFKAATDAFNEKKSENIDLLRDQEEENYKKKLKIIERAEEIKDSEEWEKTHNEYQQMMDRWKKIGPVPRKKTSKIWKKFKGTMDHFYDRRRDHFKEVKGERKENLKEKERVLDDLKKLKSHDNPIEAVNLAKPLQEEFKKAGYVPIKHKNRLWKEYRETCDVIYDRFRAAKSAADVVGKENIENFSTDDIADIQKKQKQADKLRKEIDRLSKELIQMKESLSYFKPSGSGSSLLDDVREKIDKAEQKINSKEEKLQALEIEIDKIKRSS